MATIKKEINHSHKNNPVQLLTEYRSGRVVVGASFNISVEDAVAIRDIVIEDNKDMMKEILTAISDSVLDVVKSTSYNTLLSRFNRTMQDQYLEDDSEAKKKEILAAKIAKTSKEKREEQSKVFDVCEEEDEGHIEGSIYDTGKISLRDKTHLEPVKFKHESDAMYKKRLMKWTVKMQSPETVGNFTASELRDMRDQSIADDALNNDQ